MTQRVFVMTHPGERWIALCADGQLLELALDRPGEGSRIGTIILGRVQHLDKALDAAFVAIDRNHTGFLPLRDAVSRPVEGQPVLVQIARDARGEKGARLTGRPVLAGRLLGFSPFGTELSVSGRAGPEAEQKRLARAMEGIVEPGEGWVVRRAAAGADFPELAEEADRLRRLWGGVLRRRESAKPPAELRREDDPLARILRDSWEPTAAIVFDTRAGAAAARRNLADELPDFAAKVVHRPVRDWPLAPGEIWDQVQAALEPRVPLASGGSLLFEPGQTLTAVDVDSGGFSGRRTQLRSDRALLEINLDAAREIARQIRLRNLGGILVIDFIAMPQAAGRNKVVKALREAVKRDPTPCWVAAISRLGLVEMTRKRRGPSLAEMMTVPCATCEGAGRLPRRAGVTTS